MVNIEYRRRYQKSQGNSRLRLLGREGMEEKARGHQPLVF